MDLNAIKSKTKEISLQLALLKRRIETLEGKHDFLEYCHSDICNKNKQIKAQLLSLLEKEKNLENLFFYVIKHFFPQLRIIENGLPDADDKRNQIVDISKNEIISQIYKKIQSYCFKNNLNVSTMDSILNEVNKRKLMQMVEDKEGCDDSGEIQSEIRYLEQMRDIQRKYLEELDKEKEAAVVNGNVSLEGKQGSIDNSVSSGGNNTVSNMFLNRKHQRQQHINDDNNSAYNDNDIDMNVNDHGNGCSNNNNYSLINLSNNNINNISSINLSDGLHDLM